jgi:hypothetical protein
MHRIALAALAAALLGGCSMKADMDAGAKAIVAFHQAVDAGQYRKVWAESAQDMKGATPDERLTALLDAVHRKLGRFKSGGQVGFNDNVSGAGHMLTSTTRPSTRKEQRPSNSSSGSTRDGRCSPATTSIRTR